MTATFDPPVSMSTLTDTKARNRIGEESRAIRAESIAEGTCAAPFATGSSVLLTANPDRLCFYRLGVAVERLSRFKSQDRVSHRPQPQFRFLIRRAARDPCSIQARSARIEPHGDSVQIRGGTWFCVRWLERCVLGTGPCSVTNNAIVTHAFCSDFHRSADGNPRGEWDRHFTSNPSGISCPGTCAADFATGTTVTLTATPTNGSTFNGLERL